MYNVTTLAHDWPKNACARKRQNAAAFSRLLHGSKQLHSFFSQKKNIASCSVASHCLFVALFVRTFLTTAGDGMDEWSIEQVQDFVTAEFGSEIVQNFKGELIFT